MDPEIQRSIAWFIIVSGLCGMAIPLMHLWEDRLLRRRRRRRVRINPPRQSP